MNGNASPVLCLRTPKSPRQSPARLYIPRPRAAAVAKRNEAGMFRGVTFKSASPSIVAQTIQTTARPPSTMSIEKNESHPSPACSAPIRMNMIEKMKSHEARDIVSLLQWRENDRLIGLPLPLRRHRRDSIVSLRKAIELAGGEKDVRSLAKFIQIAAKPGIDNIFARGNDHVEDGAIFQSAHGERPVKSLGIADEGEFAAGFSNIGQFARPKFAEIAQTEEALIGLGSIDGLGEMDVKADEAGGGHNHHSGGGDEACPLIDGKKTNEHGQKRNGGDEKTG